MGTRRPADRRRQEDEPTYEFPPGFRMLAGDPDRRTIDLDDPAQDAVRYVCLGGTTPEGHGQSGVTPDAT